MSNPYLSIIVPVHNMIHREYFLERLQNSLEMQTFTDFEIVITEEGKMAENTNAGLRKAKGDLIKILYMDDYLAHEQSLQTIVDNFEGAWLATGCIHDNGEMIGNPHLPTFEGIPNDQNTIGSPSVITIRNGLNIYFDEVLSWMLDVDFYKRLNAQYGPPICLSDLNVIMGIGDHQMTHILTTEEKEREEQYIKNKYA